MAKRYYICRRIGDGLDIETAYRPELREYLKNNYPSIAMSFQQQIVNHLFPWCIMCYDLTDTVHNEVMANVPNIFDFPATALNTAISVISVQKRNAMRVKLENIGFNFTWVLGTTTIREILEYIIHSIQLSVWADIEISAQNFDIDTTVSAIPAEKRNKIAQHFADLGIDTDRITGSTTIREIVTNVQKKRYLFYDEDN